MPSDMYSDNPGGDETSTDTPAQTDTSKPADNKDAHAEGETALLPKSLMAGKDFKPGEEIVLKVVRLYGDEFEVEYSHGEDKSDEKNEDMDKAHAEMDGMATKEEY